MFYYYLLRRTSYKSPSVPVGILCIYTEAEDHTHSGGQQLSILQVPERLALGMPAFKFRQIQNKR